ncbi:MAG: phosphomevalonate kinase [Bacillota bacterium]|nr:phosphomevalonate kinase [Bacillota bacterium]
MTFSSYRVRVPGKLLIAGDYAVLEPNQQAVVVAINRYITVNIEHSSENRISLPQLGLINVTWNFDDKHIQFNIVDSRLHFIQNSILIANQFLRENSIPLKPIQLTIKSDLDDPLTGRKYGLGSSAAVVVAVISSILTVNSIARFQPTLEQVFKLSAIAHLLTQKNGSGVDIAASTFGGWLAYSSFQPEWVLNELNRNGSISELIMKSWPNLNITSLYPPASLNLCVGWTGEPARTGPMINKVEKIRNHKLYSNFLQESKKAVINLIRSFETKDCKDAVASLTINRNALKMLMKTANLSIETPLLKKLSDLAETFGSGKSSGAGGGDCGIAFTENEDYAMELKLVWEKAGIIPLKLEVSKKGVSFTEYNCEMSLNEYLGLGISS